MKVIGITGGIGAGKSTVLSIFQKQYNAVILEADKIAHLLMEPGQPAYNRILKVFPASILDKEGNIIREELSQIVFRNSELLNRLNQIVHPEVKHYILNQIHQHQIANDTEYCVIEAALLIEDGYQDICDEIWYIYAPDSVRIQRLMASRSYSLEKCKSIMKNQSSDDFYRNHCTYILKNDDSIDNTQKQMELLLNNSSKCVKINR